MNNLQDAIGSILSDPQAMSKIQELSKSLGLAPQQSSQIEKSQPSQSVNSQLDMSSLASLMSAIPQSASHTHEKIQEPSLQSFLGSGSISPQLLSTVGKLLPLLSSFNKSDESTALLEALRPFLSDVKCRRLDEASKLLKIMRLLPMLKGSGLF